MRAAVNQRIRINILRVGMLLMLPILVFARPHLQVNGTAHEVMEAIGVLTLIAGVLGRFWSILYLGGRKNSEVMQDGPFSMTRNPLYFFSTVAAFGIGLMMGALSFAILIGGAVGLILYLTARREAAFLHQEFGATYDAYAGRVPFFLPDPRLFRAAPEAVFRTGPLRRNLFDAFVFLSFIPLVELLDVFKQHFALSGFLLW
ncbi:methyltransferase family protein [Paracoccus salsus]|uniref:methyltransferase family protein n=1 Tax=Paracoccus salsus TaxID=2911061 RepID=UPI001F1C89C3|nr:isoprenylcysteine carboxylmethyltransferase family protein [Paracoccus salsus]MCF3973606.1 isoprenylcysteine carboxylmethyltransferase family protein [Paracoccus salsus]